MPKPLLLLCAYVRVWIGLFASLCLCVCLCPCWVMMIFAVCFVASVRWSRRQWQWCKRRRFSVKMRVSLGQGRRYRRRRESCWNMRVCTVACARGTAVLVVDVFMNCVWVNTFYYCDEHKLNKKQISNLTTFSSRSSSKIRAKCTDGLLYIGNVWTTLRIEHCIYWKFAPLWTHTYMYICVYIYMYGFFAQWSLRFSSSEVPKGGGQCLYWR